MRYAFIAEQADAFGVQRLCQVLGVARSGYYAWKQGRSGPRAQANQALAEQVCAAYRESRQTYGSPRIHVVLRRKGVACGRHRVARLMRQEGLCARPRHKTHPLTTQRQSGGVPAPNWLNQDFAASAPNQKWVSDFTYIETGQGWLFLAVVLDLFSRKVIGWAMSETMDAELVETALHMALHNRLPQAGWLHHSDQGSQYTSLTYLDCLASARALPSMSRVANCYDNAVVESFFKTLKSECVRGRFPSRAQARTAIFEYLEVWYNRQRYHSTLGYHSPVDFEQRFRL
jgi:putative transposase